MKILLDTHLLLWALDAPERLPKKAFDLLQNLEYDFLFSTLAIWEVCIKNSRGHADFNVNPRIFHRGLLDAGYQELSILSEHVLFVDSLPLLHKDPFDRLLIAQATVEGITLLTKDKLVASYPGPIQKV